MQLVTRRNDQAVWKSYSGVSSVNPLRATYFKLFNGV